MRHRRKMKKLGRSSAHRKATISAVVCGLIEQTRIKTTLAKAKQARSQAEKMVTLGRKGTLAARRQAISKLGRTGPVKKLFDDIAPQFDGRNGGYTRIVKLGTRKSDGSEMVVLEWVGITAKSRKKKKVDKDAKDKKPTTDAKDKNPAKDKKAAKAAKKK